MNSNLFFQRIEIMYKLIAFKDETLLLNQNVKEAAKQRIIAMAMFEQKNLNAGITVFNNDEWFYKYINSNTADLLFICQKIYFKLDYSELKKLIAIFNYHYELISFIKIFLLAKRIVTFFIDVLKIKLILRTIIQVAIGTTLLNLFLNTII